MNRLLTITCLACLSMLPAGSALAADEQEDKDKDRDGRSCINASLIRSTRIIDDANILFYVRGSDIYHNQLPRQCNGLAREGRFSYRRTTSSLCQQDSIQVLYAAGTGMRQGPMCGLGYFRKITEEDAEALLNPVEPEPVAEPLPPSSPEEIVEDPHDN